jgi:hypothetical protein
MSKQHATATKESIRAVCGMLKSKTAITKALLKERARDKKREEKKFKKSGRGAF